MCCGHQRSVSPDDLIASTRNRRSINEYTSPLLEDIGSRLAETEALLERARATQDELTRRLDEMKRYLSVMQILESYLNRRSRLLSPLPAA